MKEYKDTVKDGFPVTAEIQRVWSVEMDLAHKLLEVCKKHNLRIFMESGTLLGAARHKGFIPWDDDIDFAMLRDDYDKLMALAETEFQYPYFLQNAYTDKHFVKGHASLRNEETTAISKAELDQSSSHGIFIDIFVLDGFIANPVLRFLHRTTLMLIKKTLRKFPSRRGFALYEKVFRMASLKNKLCGDLSFRYRHLSTRPVAAYRDIVMMDFEDVQFPAPIDWEDVLVSAFGDDWRTPKQLPTCHGTKYYDTERSYKIVQEELKAHPERLTIK